MGEHHPPAAVPLEPHLVQSHAVGVGERVGGWGGEGGWRERGEGKEKCCFPGEGGLEFEGVHPHRSIDSNGDRHHDQLIHACMSVCVYVGTYPSLKSLLRYSTYFSYLLPITWGRVGGWVGGWVSGWVGGWENGMKRTSLYECLRLLAASSSKTHVSRRLEQHWAVKTHDTRLFLFSSPPPAGQPQSNRLIEQTRLIQSPATQHSSLPLLPCRR